MTGLNLSQLKSEIVRPTLAVLGARYATDAAVNLVTGTALVESDLTYLRQLQDGPALGLWQMEPATFHDCWANFLRYPQFSALATATRSLSVAGGNVASELVWNLRLAAAMCRVRYYRSPLALPDAADAEGMSAMHKAAYNTPLGAANATINIPLFERAIAA